MENSSRRHVPPQELGPVLRRARLARGWSFRRAGRELGLAFGYVGELEAGRRSPSVEVAALLIRAYELEGRDAMVVRRSGVRGAGRAWEPGDVTSR